MRHWLIEYLGDLRHALLLNSSVGRSVTVYPDDVFLVSYPRVGSNWTRFLICNLIQPAEGLSLPEAEARIPGIYINSERVLRKLPRPRILKSHEPYDARYPRVIYIVRDPRDVAVSRYYFTLKWRGIPDGYPFEQFVEERFIPPGNAILNTGPWADHVIGWLASRLGQASFLLIRYEDLKANTARELGRIAALLNLRVESQRIERAIQLSSFERMQALDQKEPLKWLKRGRSDIPFIREGRTGGWRATLPEQAVAAIEAAWWPVMRLLGYEVVTRFPNGLPNPRVNVEICKALARTLNLPPAAAQTELASLDGRFAANPASARGEWDPRAGDEPEVSEESA